MRGARGGRSVLFTDLDGRQIADLTARGSDFTNAASNGKMQTAKNRHLAIDWAALKIGCLVR